MGNNVVEYSDEQLNEALRNLGGRLALGYGLVHDELRRRSELELTKASLAQTEAAIKQTQAANRLAKANLYLAGILTIATVFGVVFAGLELFLK